MGAAGLMPDRDSEVLPLTTDVLLLLPAWVWLWRLPVVLPQGCVEPLGEEFQQVLFDNLWELYAR